MSDPAPIRDVLSQSLPISLQTASGELVRAVIEFPLPDGTTLVEGPVTYDADGLTTKHSIAWTGDPAFVEAYRRGVATGHQWGADLHIEWRVYLACWAAFVAKDLDGDFVECGVNTGIFSSAICSYIDFNRYPQKHFYLLDTFEGIPPDQLTDAERAANFVAASEAEYTDTYEAVRATFAPYPNVVVIKGRVPETLALVPSERIAYLCLDMNAAAPEIAAITYFWDKIVPGGMILLDDYGFVAHAEQQRAFDAFARAHDVRIFSMPTGHGLMIKPHRSAAGS